MKLKKTLAWMSAAAAIACAMSGCTQTTIEHQFITDTHTVNEIIGSTVVPDFVPGVEELEEMLANYDIEIVTQFPLFVDPYDEKAPDGLEGAGTEVTEDAIDSLLETKKPILVCQKYNREDGISGYVDAADVCAQKLSAALKEYFTENPEILPKIKGRVLALDIRIIESADDDAAVDYAWANLHWYWRDYPGIDID